ncbi:MAG: hypothetical protein U5K69_22540 [Balneolaceae bacterium]|nr:hypothetical protein [Balneolaceae bacterium]
MEADSSIFDSILIESISENDINNPADDDSFPKGQKVDLTFKQAVEIEKLRLQPNGSVLLTQSTTSPDSDFESFFWEHSDLLQKLRLSSNQMRYCASKIALFISSFIPSFAIPARVRHAA